MAIKVRTIGSSVRNKGLKHLKQWPSLNYFKPSRLSTRKHYKNKIKIKIRKSLKAKEKSHQNIWYETLLRVRTACRRKIKIKDTLFIEGNTCWLSRLKVKENVHSLKTRK
jgi:hypothetical protein